jgi:hypothetical protein
MKYLITESQFDKIIFKYLDNQDFIFIQYGVNDYFVNSEKDEYAQISFNKKARWCTINYDLLKEVSSFFSISYSDALPIINKWAEKAFGVTTLATDVQSKIFVYYF